MKNKISYPAIGIRPIIDGRLGGVRGIPGRNDHENGYECSCPL